MFFNKKIVLRSLKYFAAFFALSTTVFSMTEEEREQHLKIAAEKQLEATQALERDEKNLLSCEICKITESFKDAAVNYKNAGKIDKFEECVSCAIQANVRSLGSVARYLDFYPEVGVFTIKLCGPIYNNLSELYKLIDNASESARYLALAQKYN